MDEPRPSVDGRQCAMLAHLCVLANVVFPFSGLLAGILIYVLRPADAPVDRANQRNALNLEITLALVFVALFVVYFVMFLTIFVTAVHAGTASRHARASIPPGFVAILALWAVIFAVGLSSIVAGCFGARAAWIGRPFRY